MNALKIENIRNIRMNGSNVTLFDVYTLQADEYGQESYIFDRADSLNGTIKRESTIIRKLAAQ